MSASTYEEAAASGQSNTVKPVFIKEIDFFGVKKPPREQWIVNTELYKAIASVVPSEHLIGLQRVTGGLWRIYLDNSESRSNLLTSDFTFRGKSMPIYHTNPGFRYVDSTQMDPTLRIRIQNVPLSADDGQIKRALELKNCTVKKLYREKLRVDGRLTNCETGDRIAITNMIETPLPIFMEIGRYRAKVHHRGQYNDKLKCNKCLQTGHVSKECMNDVVCKACNNPCHIMADCPDQWESEEASSENNDSEDIDGDGDDESESAEESNSLLASLQATSATPAEQSVSLNKTDSPASKPPGVLSYILD